MDSFHHSAAFHSPSHHLPRTFLAFCHGAQFDLYAKLNEFICQVKCVFLPKEISFSGTRNDSCIKRSALTSVKSHPFRLRFLIMTWWILLKTLFLQHPLGHGRLPLPKRGLRATKRKREKKW